jgi:GR25 family glycosyltransferase involved in LPS biosynthesis
MTQNKDLLITLAKDQANLKSKRSFLPIKGRVIFIVENGLSLNKSELLPKTHQLAKDTSANGFEVVCLVKPCEPSGLSRMDSEVVLDNVRYVYTHSNLSCQNEDESEYLKFTVNSFVELFEVLRPDKVVVAGGYKVGLATYVVSELFGIPYINEIVEPWELLRTKSGEKYATLQLEQKGSREAFVARKAAKNIVLDEYIFSELVKRGVKKSNLIVKELLSCGTHPFNKKLEPLIEILNGGFQENTQLSAINENCTANSSQKNVALIFTNLGLTTIDGSSVFIANMLKVYSSVYDSVVLLSAQEIGPNFSDRIKGIPNLHVKRSSGPDCKKDIVKLDSEYGFSNIFVRAWGDRSLWFDKEFSEKVTYYWPLTEKPTTEDNEIFHSVRTLAFQTEELRDKTFSLMGEKSYILCPPLVEVGSPKKGDEEKIKERVPVLSYVGTLREECFSEELLQAFLNIKETFKSSIQLNIVIGKIFYLDNKKRDIVQSLLQKLKSYDNVSIREKLTQSECNKTLLESDISFSLWEPNPQNSIQVSTKMLDCLAMGCNVITFATQLHKKLLGDSYKFFIDSIDELESKLVESIEVVQRKRQKFSNNYMLSQFSLNWHRLNLINKFNIQHPSKKSYEVALFNEQFDEIYGVFINSAEKRKFEFLNNLYSLNILPFKGVNGRDELEKEYSEYCKRPLETEWEKRAGKKRLTIGAMGHLASFISVCEDALLKGHKKILILESDVLFHNQAFSLNFLSRPSGFEVLYLGAGKWNTNLKYSETKQYYYPNQTTGTFAVAIDSSVMPDLISEWKKFIEPSDVAMWKITNKAPNKSFVVNPNLVICDVATSLTGSGRSQQKIAERFDWELSEYLIHSVEYIDKYYDRLEITLDHFISGAFLKLKTRRGESTVLVEKKVLTLDVHDVIEEIEFGNLFISNIQPVQ